jgi:hypothetical protein
MNDHLEEFRNKFYKMLEDEKIEKEREMKRKQKNCFHKYTKTIPYNTALVIRVCEKCSHAKLVKYTV